LDFPPDHTAIGSQPASHPSLKCTRKEECISVSGKIFIPAVALASQAYSPFLLKAAKGDFLIDAPPKLKCTRKVQKIVIPSNLLYTGIIPDQAFRHVTGQAKGGFPVHFSLFT
jgi:hypothetical protein